MRKDSFKAKRRVCVLGTHTSFCLSKNLEMLSLYYKMSNLMIGNHCHVRVTRSQLSSHGACAEGKEGIVSK